MTKKILILTAVLTLVLTLLAAPALAFDENDDSLVWYIGTDFVAEGTNAQEEGGDHMAFTSPGTYATYANVDFGDGSFKSMHIFAGADPGATKGGSMEIHLDTMDGELIGEMEIKPTTAWADYQLFHANLTQTVTGVHTLCLKFNVNMSYLFNYTQFCFSDEVMPDDVLAAQKYELPSYEFDTATAYDWYEALNSSTFTTTIEDDHMAYTTADTFAIYNNLDFGNGMPGIRFEIEAGTSDTEGGTIELRLDDEDGYLLGSVEMPQTGGWANYELLTIEIAEADQEKLRGVQPICLVFRVKEGSTYCCNYLDFRFNGDFAKLSFEKPLLAVDFADGSAKQDVTITDAKGDVAINWSVDDESVASVDQNGVVTFKTEGVVNVIAATDASTARYKMKITKVEAKEEPAQPAAEAEAPADTEAEAAADAETPASPEVTGAGEVAKKGCGSFLGGSMIVLTAVLGSAWISRRKD